MMARDISVSVYKAFKILALAAFIMAGTTPVMGQAAETVTAQDDTIAETQTPATEQQMRQFTSKDWAVECSPPDAQKTGFCQAVNDVGFEGNDQILLRVFVTPVSYEDSNIIRVLRVQLPHGMRIPSGVQIRVDTASQHSLAYQTSLADGIFARIDLTAKMIETMKTGNAMALEFETIARQKVIVFINLESFAAAVDQI